jgi:hypothetical protein
MTQPLTLLGGCGSLLGAAFQKMAAWDFRSRKHAGASLGGDCSSSRCWSSMQSVIAEDLNF